MKTLDGGLVLTNQFDSWMEENREAFVADIFGHAPKPKGKVYLTESQLWAQCRSSNGEK